MIKEIYKKKKKGSDCSLGNSILSFEKIDKFGENQVKKNSECGEIDHLNQQVKNTTIYDDNEQRRQRLKMQVPRPYEMRNKEQEGN